MDGEKQRQSGRTGKAGACSVAESGGTPAAGGPPDSGCRASSGAVHSV
jgi:hypothetical protein